MVLGLGIPEGPFNNIYSFISNKLHVDNKLHIHIAHSKCNLVVVAKEDLVLSSWQPEK